MPIPRPPRPLVLMMLISAALMLPTLAVLAIGASRGPVPKTTSPALAHGGRGHAWGSPHEREFDFWVGEWDVQNQHLQRDGTWKDTSTARARIQFILGGRAVLEQWIGQGDNRLRGFSLRAYDPALARWVVILNWTGGRPSTFGPMEGVYDEDHISIYAPGALESGQQSIERYTFSKAMPESCQWDAARTTDGGNNWQMYWVMKFRRRAGPITTDASNAPIFAVPERPYCTGADHRALDGIIGAWTGEIRRLTPDGSWRTGEVVMRGTSMIEGCGIQTFIDATFPDDEMYQSFEAASYHQSQRKWVAKAINTDAPGIRTLAGTADSETGLVTFDLKDAASPRRVVITGLSGDTIKREVQVRSGNSDEWKTIETIKVTRTD